MKAKLIGNTLIFAPATISLPNGGIVCNPNNEQLIEAGYKDVVYPEMPILKSNEYVEEVYSETETINVDYVVKVNVDNIQDFEPEKRFEIKAAEKQYLNLVIAVPDLLDYLKQSSIKVYEQDNFRMFYVNSFLPGHRETLEYYLGLKSITDRNRNGNE